MGIAHQSRWRPGTPRPVTDSLATGASYFFKHEARDPLRAALATELLAPLCGKTGIVMHTGQVSIHTHVTISKVIAYSDL